jgi:cupin fold WbuC family metalloprotein
MHRTDDEAVHRLFVAMQPDSYIQHHRHLDPLKTESLIVLSGTLGFLEFDAEGIVIAQRRLGNSGACIGIDIPAGCWHGIVALAPDTLFFEAKAGPYQPLSDRERAFWAPPEGATAACSALQQLQSLFSA